jgi:hypothetical protein
VLFATLVITACVTPASASTKPGAALGKDSFQIDLYEPEPDTNPEFSTTLLPLLVVSGFVVLRELENKAIWSDIVEFRTVVGGKSYADFWSDVEGQAFDQVLVERVKKGNTVYLLEDHCPTVYDPGYPYGYPYDNLYRIWSDVPEPATICLFGLGVLSLLKKRR